MNNWCIFLFFTHFLLGILIFKGLTTRRLYKSFSVNVALNKNFLFYSSLLRITILNVLSRKCVQYAAVKKSLRNTYVV
jgi:hypothetical protein